MAGLQGITSNNPVEAGLTFKALHATQRPPQALGFYRIAGTSGLATTIAAGTNTAGHMFAFRNSTATLMIVTRFGMKWVTVAGFTAAQEVAMKLFHLSSYSVSHTGQSPLTAVKKRVTHAASVLADARISNAGALTAGTHTIDTPELLSMACSELATGAAIPKCSMEALFTQENDYQYPIVLGANEGLLIRNEILMGAGGTGRLIVEMDWFDCAAADWPG